jgi:hypothetical protein
MEGNIDNSSVNNIIDFYFRSTIWIIVMIVLSIIYKKTDYMYQLCAYIVTGTFNSYILLLNLVALYLIFYKIKFRITFSIIYN